MPLLSALHLAFRALSFRIGVALDLLAATGARRLADTYHRLDNEPYHDTWTDDEAEHTQGVASAGRGLSANSLQVGKLRTSGE